ncbi:MAG: M16 family metallopeptidase [Rhodospirillales bacterium]
MPFAPRIRHLTAPITAVLALALAGPVDAAVFEPETFTLKNGLQVVVVSNHRAPVVSQMVYYKVGGADDPIGKGGIAHFLEHLMFKGTKNLEPGEFSRTLARNGARENAFTSPDATAYYQTIARDRLEVAMRLEAERMTNLIIDTEAYEPERQVVLEERRMRVENSPAALLSEQTSAALYLNHPYRRPIIGWPEEIRAINGDDLNTFYRHHYAPNNAILVLSGDITAAEAKPLAEKYYGPLKPQTVPPRNRVDEPETRTTREVTLRDERVRQPSLARRYLAPSYTWKAENWSDGWKDADPDMPYALQVLASILGGGQVSPLYRNLVIEQGLAIGAGASYDANALGPGDLVFYASPKPGTDMADLEAALEREIQRLIADGLDAVAVERAKRAMQADAVFARDSLTAGARSLGGALAIGRSIDDVESWPDRIAAVTPEQVNTALKLVLDGRPFVTSRLLPAAAKQEG